MSTFAKGPEATIEDTGSTNRPGLRVTFDHEGHATVEGRGGEVQHVKLRDQMCNRFLHELESGGPLNEVATVHCMKSVSFGSSMFIEFNGERSHDMSCPAPQDSRAQTLQKQAHEILEAAREAAGIPSRRVFTVPGREQPK